MWMALPCRSPYAGPPLRLLVYFLLQLHHGINCAPLRYLYQPLRRPSPHATRLLHPPSLLQPRNEVGLQALEKRGKVRRQRKKGKGKASKKGATGAP